jgi:hypothetical protein
VDIAERDGLTIKEVERSLQEYRPLGLFWIVVQKWTKEYRKDTTNPAYRAIKEMMKEIRAEGQKFLEGYHSRHCWDGKPLDLTYWTLRLHLSIDMDWRIHRSVTPLYSWRMFRKPNAELHFGIPTGGQQWNIEVNLLDKPLESLRDRGVIMPSLAP